VIWSGDPFEALNLIDTVFIRGQQHPESDILCCEIAIKIPNSSNFTPLKLGKIKHV